MIGILLSASLYLQSVQGSEPQVESISQDDGLNETGVISVWSPSGIPTIVFVYTPSPERCGTRP